MRPSYSTCATRDEFWSRLKSDGGTVDLGIVRNRFEEWQNQQNQSKKKEGKQRNATTVIAPVPPVNWRSSV